MKKLWLLGIILILSSCSFPTPSTEKFTVSFNSNGGSLIESIEIEQDDVLDFNLFYIPERAHFNFEGWHYDEELGLPYDKNQEIKSDMTLYARWSKVPYQITFILNNGEDNEVLMFEYQATILFPTPEFFEHEFMFWYETDDEIPFTDEIMPGSDLVLHAKWEHSIINHVVSFELNGSATVIANIIVLNQEKIDEPIKPTKDGYLFAGWYIDQELQNLYDFDTLVTTDLVLYAKWQVRHEIDEVEHEINGDLLTWEVIPDALFFDVYIGDDMDTPISVEEPLIHLKPYEGLLLNPKNVEVYVIFLYGESYLIFDAVLQFKNLNGYDTGFEASDGFVSSTSYNNQTPKLQGNTDNQFSILSGSVSTTTPISGNQSLQLRYYTANPNTYGYAENVFPISDVSSVTFSARSSTQHVMVSHSTDGGTSFMNEVTYQLTSTAQQFNYTINKTGSIKLRFTLVKNSNTNSSSLLIDDLVIYSLIGDKTLIEVVDIPVSDYPESDEVALATLKNRFQSQRNSLGVPGFTIPMTNEGKIEYYAALNGLSGHAFRTELSNILTSNHLRKMSYDEARFVLEQSDLVIDDQNRQYLNGIYSGTKIVKYWDGGATWAREHVWPNSRLAMSPVDGSDRNQGSDVHNLRAINPSVNSSRSNRYFNNGLSSFNGPVGGAAYYPGDEYRGDVARILFYMAARYDFLTLRDTNIDTGTTYTESAAIMGILSILIEWHELDPVDAFEQRRNDIIYSYQGNRNPFIDFPEYVGVYYGT